MLPVFDNKDIHVELMHINRIVHSDYTVLELLHEGAPHISYILMQFQHIILFQLLQAFDEDQTENKYYVNSSMTLRKIVARIFLSYIYIFILFIRRGKHIHI